MRSARSVAPRAPQTTSPSVRDWLVGRSPAGAPVRKPGYRSVPASTRDAARCWGNWSRLSLAPDHPQHGIRSAVWPFHCGYTREADARGALVAPSDSLDRARSERDRPDPCSTSPNRALRQSCTLVRSGFFRHGIRIGDFHHPLLALPFDLARFTPTGILLPTPTRLMQDHPNRVAAHVR